MAERGCTAHAIMAVSGHLTLRGIERFTKMANRARNARRRDAEGRTGRQQNLQQNLIEDGQTLRAEIV
jgi:hypothetical protein